jgi:pimeloyl-ACP methyl ester carboxylesterase
MTFVFTPSVYATDLSLQERWELEKQNPLSTVDALTLEVIRDRHILFVPGLTNEITGPLGQYFSASMQAIRSELNSSASYFGPPSWQFHSNINSLYKQILATHQRLKKPIILICHSKGGLECLHTILRHPSLIFHHQVDRVILIQSAIKGSSVINDQLLKLPFRIAKLIPDLITDGFRSLEPYYAERNLTRAFAEFDRYLKKEFSHLGMAEIRMRYDEVSSKIFYVRSLKDYPQLPSTAHYYFSFFYRSIDYSGSDGLLRVEDQQDERIGRDLGVIVADHCTLTVNTWFGGADDSDKRAFIRALIQNVYEKAPEEKECASSGPSISESPISGPSISEATESETAIIGQP